MKPGIKVRFENDSMKLLRRLLCRLTNAHRTLARRLHTVMEKLVEDASFDAPDMNGANVIIDAKYVEDKLQV